MKKTITLWSALFMLFISLTGTAQETVPVNGAEITFDKMTYDYGVLEYASKDNTCYFTFTNTGSSPLTISQAKGSCGCTVPEWPREPIAPGKTGKIKVEYKTTKVGMINKSVFISSNATKEPVVLRIKGEVKPQPATATVEKSEGPVVK